MDKVSLDAAREAAGRLTDAEHARRRAEADKVEALCDLAVAYDLDDEELFLEVLIDQRIQIGGSGTPLISEMVSLEIAGLLKIPVAHAASTSRAGLGRRGWGTSPRSRAGCIGRRPPGTG